MNARSTRRAAMQAFASAIPLAAQNVPTPVTSPGKQPTEQSMELGAFSISLAVKDLKASRQFYEKFGFKAFAGDASRGVLILKNGDHVIGLFQGMFDNN